MTTYFVGPGGNDGNSGLTWALRKLTLNGAEDVPVVAGDVVYVGPGVYRELLTCDVSGGNTYTTGTVTVTQGSDQVTGAGTAWVANVAAGYWFHVRYYLYNTDGVTNGTSTFTSAAGNFHANLIGMPIQINTRGAYTISAVAGANSLTLADPNGLGWPAAAGGLTYSCMTGEGHYEIESVDDNTTITLVQPWQGPTHSGLAYITFNAITYIGDCTGENTSGVGGICRISGSDNDQTGARASTINLNGTSYRVFRGFLIDFGYINPTSTGAHWLFEDLVIADQVGYGYQQNSSATCVTFRRIVGQNNQNGLFYIQNGSDIDDAAFVLENINCFTATYYAIRNDNLGGVTIRNCSVNANKGYYFSSSPTTGQCTWMVHNFLNHCYTAVQAATLGDIIEDYNCFAGNGTDRSNVGTGSNSNLYEVLMAPPILYAGADELSGFNFPWRFGNLSQWSPVRAIAGFDERNTDMYGIRRPATAAKNSWGPVQYHDTQRETTTTHGGSATSIKLADAAVHHMWVPVTAVSTTIEVYVYREANYAGTNPQMIIKQPGQADRTTTDAAAASQWNLLTDTFVPSADTDYLVVELKSNNTAAAGNYDTFFDDLQVS